MIVMVQILSVIVHVQLPSRRIRRQNHRSLLPKIANPAPVVVRVENVTSEDVHAIVHPQSHPRNPPQSHRYVYSTF